MLQKYVKETMYNVWLVFLLVPRCENATLSKQCLSHIASYCRVLPWLDVSLLHCGVELYRNTKTKTKKILLLPCSLKEQTEV